MSSSPAHLSDEDTLRLLTAGTMAVLQKMKRKREQIKGEEGESEPESTNAKISTATRLASEALAEAGAASVRSRSVTVKQEEQETVLWDTIHSKEEEARNDEEEEVEEEIVLRYPPFENFQVKLTNRNVASLASGHNYSANVMDIMVLYYRRQSDGGGDSSSKRKLLLLRSEVSQLIFGADGVRKNLQQAAAHVLSKELLDKGNAVLTTMVDGRWIGVIILGITKKVSANSDSSSTDSELVVYNNSKLMAGLDETCFAIIYDVKQSDKASHTRIMKDIKDFLSCAIARKDKSNSRLNIKMKHLVASLPEQEFLQRKDTGPLILCHIGRYFKNNMSLDGSDIVPRRVKADEPQYLKDYTKARDRCNDIIRDLCETWKRRNNF